MSPKGTRPSGSDIWNDAFVLFYLKYKTYPPGINESEKSRIRKRAKSYTFVGAHLYKVGRRGAQKRLIPRYEERLEIVHELHFQMNHRKNKCMLNQLRTIYFWDHMAQDVQTVITSCSICRHGI